MELIVGAKLKDKRRDAWLAALTGQLYPGEQLTVLVGNNLVRPTCNALALTTVRVLAFFDGDLARNGFKINLHADDLVHAEVASKWGSIYLVLTTTNGETTTVARVDEEDAVAVLSAARKLVAVGSPQRELRQSEQPHAELDPLISSVQPRPHPSPAPTEFDSTSVSKRRVGAAARTTVAHIHTFAKHATALLSEPDALRESARQ